MIVISLCHDSQETSLKVLLDYRAILYITTVTESYRYIQLLGSLIRCMIIDFLNCILLFESRDENTSG